MTRGIDITALAPLWTFREHESILIPDAGDDDDDDDDFLGRFRTNVSNTEDDDVNMNSDPSVDALAIMFEGIC